ncbi:MAG TPA: Hsp70 family protein [Polyangia bacterium]
MGSGIHVGIDLGTSNSAIALFDGDAVSVIGNAAGETLTPSVVRIDGRGRRTIGRRAAAGLDGDPANTRAEWKRLMGTAERLPFEASGAALLPEELSAEVIRALLADVRDAAGFLPRAAVISTPALFELPQCHATARAGRQAGLEEVVLIQEPIASAIAAGWRTDDAGTWLVFDLGGGTLDVSLLETAEGRLRVVDHAGDNFLGGKDMDGALVAWALGRLGRDGAALEAGRADARGRRALARLRAACEQAKIALSRAEHATIVAPDPAGDGEDGGRELDITRDELDALTAPFIARSLTAVRDLLAKNQRAADDVARVVLVGGPTLMPGLRVRVGAMFGGRIAAGVDPMTIVARGAALYAASVGLDATPAARTAGAGGAGGLPIRIEHPSVTADLEPFVVGRCLPGAGQALPDRVRVERADGGDVTWASPSVALSAEGSFVIQVGLERGRRSHFRVRAFDRAGGEVALATREFAIVHGVSIGDPPLARAIGVARADDSTHVYFAKGTPLPARRTFAHQTVVAIEAGSDADALAIPIVQGESHRAHRNRLIGMLQLRGVSRDLPAGSRIEVTLELDRSGQLATRADVPGIGQTFEDVAFVLVPTATVETAERELAATSRRAADVQRRTFQLGVPAAVQAIGDLSALLAEADRALPAARGGAVDAAQKLHRLLMDANAALDGAEALLEWPDLDAEARRCKLTYTPLVAQWGTPAEQQLYEQELEAAGLARQRNSVAELELHLDAMRVLGRAAYCRDPRSMSDAIDWAAAHVTEALDVTAAASLLDRARALQAQGAPQAQGMTSVDPAGNAQRALRALVAEIWELFPASPELRAKSFDSAIR